MEEVAHQPPRCAAKSAWRCVAFLVSFAMAQAWLSSETWKLCFGATGCYQKSLTGTGEVLEFPNESWNSQKYVLITGLAPKGPMISGNA